MERNDRAVKRFGAALLLVLAALLAVTLQAGCTAVNGRPMAGTAAAEQAAVSTAEVVVHLTFSGTSPGKAAEFTKQEVAEWNAANPHIQVTLVEGQATGPDRYGLYLQTFQAQSPAIDVMLIDVTWPGDLAEHLDRHHDRGNLQTRVTQPRGLEPPPVHVAVRHGRVGVAFLPFPHHHRRHGHLP